MDYPTFWGLLTVVAIVAFALGALLSWYLLRKKRSRQFREHFGSEYERLVEETGDHTRAEQELLRREERVKLLDIRPLSPEQRTRFTEDWRAVQARFADAPAQAVAEADALITQVMRVRGYPMGDFEQRAADISIDHPRVVEHYRAAHALALRSEHGEATTEELRQAMLHYRTLFEDLLEHSRTDGTDAGIDKMEARR